MRSFHWRPPDDSSPQGSQLMTRQEALENGMHSSQWAGGDALFHFDRTVKEIAKSL